MTQSAPAMPEGVPAWRDSTLGQGTVRRSLAMTQTSAWLSRDLAGGVGMGAVWSRHRQFLAHLASRRGVDRRLNPWDESGPERVLLRFARGHGESSGLHGATPLSPRRAVARVVTEVAESEVAAARTLASVAASTNMPAIEAATAPASASAVTPEIASPAATATVPATVPANAPALARAITIPVPRSLEGPPAESPSMGGVAEVSRMDRDSSGVREPTGIAVQRRPFETAREQTSMLVPESSGAAPSFEEGGQPGVMASMPGRDDPLRSMALIDMPVAAPMAVRAAGGGDTKVSLQVSRMEAPGPVPALATGVRPMAESAGGRLGSQLAAAPLAMNAVPPALDAAPWSASLPAHRSSLRLDASHGMPHTGLPGMPHTGLPGMPHRAPSDGSVLHRSASLDAREEDRETLAARPAAAADTTALAPLPHGSAARAWAPVTCVSEGGGITAARGERAMVLAQAWRHAGRPVHHEATGDAQAIAPVTSAALPDAGPAAPAREAAHSRVMRAATDRLEAPGDAGADLPAIAQTAGGASSHDEAHALSHTHVVPNELPPTIVRPTITQRTITQRTIALEGADAGAAAHLPGGRFTLIRRASSVKGPERRPRIEPASNPSLVLRHSVGAALTARAASMPMHSTSPMVAPSLTARHVHAAATDAAARRQLADGPPGRVQDEGAGMVGLPQAASTTSAPVSPSHELVHALSFSGVDEHAGARRGRSEAIAVVESTMPVDVARAEDPVAVSNAQALTLRQTLVPRQAVSAWQAGPLLQAGPPGFARSSPPDATLRSTPSLPHVSPWRAALTGAAVQGERVGPEAADIAGFAGAPAGLSSQISLAPAESFSSPVGMALAGMAAADMVAIDMAPDPGSRASRPPTRAAGAVPSDVDVDAIAERACRLVLDRLAIEHERRGFARWS
ncbi:hypothetical protein [Ideonella sp. YS5]|uniref:hypothetical protein n=1 Tax=Ideonella sp. YS5 TaxID=3453714 RepID=UPI003EEDEE31